MKTTHKLFDLALGSRFRYLLDDESVYVLLSKDDRGRIASAPEKPVQVQSIHAAATTRQELLRMRVYFVPMQEVTPS